MPGRAFDASAQLEEDDLHHGGPWPDWIPLGAVAEAVPALAAEYAQLDDKAFNLEGVRLGEIIAGVGGAYLCDEVRNDTLTGKGKRKAKARADRDLAIDGLTRAMALGSLCPGGIKLWGVWFETVDGDTAMRVLV